jgi:hypothetical protein
LGNKDRTSFLPASVAFFKKGNLDGKKRPKGQLSGPKALKHPKIKALKIMQN